MSFLDEVSTKVHDELKKLALKHPSYESFMQDVERLGDTMWHNAHSQAESDAQVAVSQAESDAETAAAGVVADAEKDVSSPAQTTSEPAEGTSEPADSSSTPAAS